MALGHTGACGYRAVDDLEPKRREFRNCSHDTRLPHDCRGRGYSALSALLVVAVLITPTIILTIDGRFEQLHGQLYLATVALGLTPAQRLAWVYLPAARTGLIAAMILGFGRAVGDTVIALMIAGNATHVPSSITGAVRTLTSHIALVLAADTQSGAYYSLFAAGLLLFLFVLLANIALRYIGSKERST